MKVDLEPKNRRQAFSLMETIVAVLIAGIAITAMVTGFVSSLRSSEASAYSLAAGTLAMQGYEQIRAAKWDAVAYPNVDEVQGSNFPPAVYVLDVPSSGANIVYATNFTTINLISTNPMLKSIRVDCVYRFMNRGLLTNSIVSLRTTESGQQNAAPAAPPPPPPPVTPPAGGTTPKKNNRAKK